MTPRVAFSLSPDGNFPPDSFQFNGRVPPVTPIFIRTFEPVVIAGNEVVVIDSDPCAHKPALDQTTNHTAASLYCAIPLRILTTL